MHLVLCLMVCPLAPPLSPLPAFRGALASLQRPGCFPVASRARMGICCKSPGDSWGCTFPAGCLSLQLPFPSAGPVGKQFGWEKSWTFCRRPRLAVLVALGAVLLHSVWNPEAEGAGTPVGSWTPKCTAAGSLGASKSGRGHNTGLSAWGSCNLGW